MIQILKWIIIIFLIYQQYQEKVIKVKEDKVKKVSLLNPKRRIKKMIQYIRENKNYKKLKEWVIKMI